MGIIPTLNTFVAGTPIVASAMNSNFEAIVTVVNGGLDDSNILSLSASKIQGQLELGNMPRAASGVLTATGAGNSPAYQAVTVDDIADGSITNAKIVSVAANKLTGRVLAANMPTSATANRVLAVGTANTSPSYIQAVTDMVADLAITTGKLANEAVTTGKLDGLSVTSAKLADNAVSTGKIENLAVTTGKIANGAVTRGKIANATSVNDGITYLQFQWLPARSLIMNRMTSAGAPTIVTAGANAEVLRGNGFGLISNANIADVNASKINAGTLELARLPVGASGATQVAPGQVSSGVPVAGSVRLVAYIPASGTELAAGDLMTNNLYVARWVNNANEQGFATGIGALSGTWVALSGGIRSSTSVSYIVLAVKLG